MQQLLSDSTELADTISDALTIFRDGLKIVIEAISRESAYTLKVTSFAVTTSIIELMDDIFDFYGFEWAIVNRSIIELNEWINRILYEQATNINNLIISFDNLTDILIQRLSKQLAAIDNTVSPQYQQRMFLIYGRIAEFSEAINTPPFYLEGLIRNARSFAISVSCLMGLPYYQFESDWDDGVNRLLIKISNSVTLYQENPQWIKIDIENSLIKPLFEIARNKRLKEVQQFSLLSKDVIELKHLTINYKTQLDENKQAIDNLFDEKVVPALKEITDAFDVWKEDTYENKMSIVDKSFVQLFIDIVEKGYEIAKLIALLDLPADILLRINKLSGILRFDQEDKMNEVTTRAFRRIVPEWLETVKESVD